MPAIHLSKGAERDLREVLTYTVAQWGKQQADNYMNGLDGLFAHLLAQPGIGRFYSLVHPRWQRIEHESHIILYSFQKDGITIQRVLHNRQRLHRGLR